MNVQERVAHESAARGLNDLVEVTLLVRRRDINLVKSLAQSNALEKMVNIRKLDYDQMQASLTHCVRMAQCDHGGARVMAQFMASLYNGDRVKADVSGIRSLDLENFEHLMNAMRFCYEMNSEPHKFFVNGNDLFERIIKNWGLEKRRRS